MDIKINQDELNSILKVELLKIFENKDFGSLSDFQRRKCIFDYLVNNSEYDFKLLNDLYTYKKRNFTSEVLSVLKPENENKRSRNMQ